MRLERILPAYKADVLTIKLSIHEYVFSSSLFLRIDNYKILCSAESMRTWTDDQLMNLIKTSNTYADVLRELGYPAIGSYYRFLKKHIKRLNLDTSHFGRIKKQTSWNKIQLKDILIIGEVQPTTLRTIIKKENLLKQECYGCGLSTWKSSVTNNEEVPIHAKLSSHYF